MKFTEKHIKWQPSYFVGRKNGFLFEIKKKDNALFYFSVEHKTKDIRYNSLWEHKSFISLDLVKTACEDWKPNEHCLGVDA